jgi:CubicO group peptidase (beta-lactamase class C family)
VNLILLSVMALFMLYSCSKNEIVSVSWQPTLLGDGWQVSGAREQGLDSNKINNLYNEANSLDNLYSLLVIKNGYLISEKYFNGKTVTDASATASVTKSITSALAGIALNEGFIKSTDQKLTEFFPELDWESTDSRKSEITLQQLLQMRSGYPWEESDGYLNKLFTTSAWIPFLIQFPLMHDPGTQFGYSNLTAHIMGIIIARSAKTSLKSFALEYLFDYLDVTIPNWPVDAYGYYFGMGDMYLRPRHMAKFGQLYLNHGNWNNKQVIQSEWITRSLQIYSPTTYSSDIHTHIHQLGYGFLWWSGISGNYHYNFAWGHGGQMIVIIQGLNMVIVTTAAPQPGFDNSAWQKEKAVMELVGRFIEQL